MSLNVPRELAALQLLSTRQLQLRYAEVFGEATRANHRTWLIKRLLWRLQALAEGDLSERARRRAAELANDAALRLSPPRAELNTPTPTPAPAATVAPEAPTPTLPFSADDRLPTPGTVLTRPYKGGVVQVLVRADGFECQGRVYRSLSAVATAVTGTHTHGFLFFR